jgi:guanine nucleotide-binding protein subunit beta-2-like 1 protein
MEYFATTGWDGYLKIWNKNFQIKYTFRAHDEAINALSIAPTGKYIATGGKDNQVKIWDIDNLKEASIVYQAKSQVNDLKFNPTNQWLAAATDRGILIWDLQDSQQRPFESLQHQTTKNVTMGKNKQTFLEKCTSLEWNSQGTRLFGGC